MQQLGVLEIIAQGGERFRLLRHWVEDSGLQKGEIELIAAPAVLPVPGAYARLVPLLRAIVEDMGGAGAPNAPAAPHRFFDAGWLGMRYAEVLPIPALARQKLLELDDSIDRLEIIYRFLESKGLLPDS
jgi:Lon protease-like protein